MKTLGRIEKGLLIGLPVGILVYIIVMPLKAITNIFLPLVVILLPGASPVTQKVVSFFLMLLFIDAIGCLIAFLHPIKRIKKILLKMPPLKKIFAIQKGQELPQILRGKRVVSVKFGDLSLLGILIGELSVNNDENEKPEKKINVFVPNSPTIFTGFVVQAPPEKVSFMENLSVSQFFAFVSTYGVKSPGSLKEVCFKKASLQ